MHAVGIRYNVVPANMIEMVQLLTNEIHVYRVEHTYISVLNSTRSSLHQLILSEMVVYFALNSDVWY